MNKTKYMQTDSRWSELGYPKYPCTIGNSGCGEVSVCNCIIEMKQYESYTPKTIQPYCKQFSASNCDGTYWSGIPKMMANYGLTEVKEHATMDSLWKELAKGDRVAIYLMGSRSGGSLGVHWTSGGHFICSVDYRYKDNDHQVYIKDSYSNASNRNGWCGYKTHLRGDVSAVWSGKLNGAKPSPTPKKKLVVNGVGDTATIMRMQQFFGTTQDGIISGQNKNLKSWYPSIQAVSFGSGGSACVRELQRWVGVSSDGIIGEKTTKAWQTKLTELGYYKSKITGIFGVKSMKAMQECLNNNGKKKGGKPTPTPKPTPTKEIKIVDVSAYQDTINWTKAKADGIKGAIVRCGFRGYESGKLQTDSMFLNHIKGAYKAGLPVGIYMVTEAKTAKEGREEADYAIKLWQTAGVPLSFPIAVDSEAAGGSKDRCKNLTKAQRTEAVKGFCEQIKKHGYTPMIYASTSWLNNKLDMSKLPYDVWVAQYNSTCDYKGKYIIWQYSSKGSVDGIKGNVDMNKCYYTPKKYEPKPTPKPTPSKKTYDGSYPTSAEIKSASNVGTGRRIVAWCKQICESGEYKYKLFTDDPKTQQCPICHNLSGKYKGWNCIGFSWAAWRHGGGIPSKCNCEVINDNKGNQLIRASSDAEATKMVQKCAGITDLKVIRNKNGIPESDLNLGDIILYYDGNEYEHSLVYVGDGKVADSGRGHTPQVMFGGTYKKNKCKVAIQYTGGNSYLQRLDKGKGVRKIKDYLEWYDTKTKLADDDSFGNGTRNAVIAFQEKEMGKGQGDGFVGQKTIDAMKKVQK